MQVLPQESEPVGLAVRGPSRLRRAGTPLLIAAVVASLALAAGLGIDLARFRVPGARPALLDCIGVTTAPLDRASRQSLGVKGSDGLVVTSIDPEGPAAAAGIGVGDVLAARGGKVTANGTGDGASLTVTRGAGATRVPLALPDDCGTD